MLTFSVPDELKTEVEAFLDSAAYDTSNTKNVTYDEMLSTFWTSLYDPTFNTAPLFSEEITFGEAGQPDQITEKYKMSLRN